VRPSISRCSTSPPRAPDVLPLDASPGPLLSVDVEEWYHNCWVAEYVRPECRPPLTEELDRLLPELLDRFDGLGVRATFFALGEVAARMPARIREIVERGHEVACHGEHHVRVGELPVARFRREIALAKDRLEQTVGRRVDGYRSPEWSLRSLANPRLIEVARAGFRYDSSLMPSIGAGSTANPLRVARLRWPGGPELLELPPMVWGGRARLPAGGWCGRLAPPSWIARAAEHRTSRGESPVLVVHPWELVERPCPGLYTGLARWFHEAGRAGYGERFDDLMLRLRCRRTLGELATDRSTPVVSSAPVILPAIAAPALEAET